jgi:transcriptional regulator with XRE-family HTH domain
MTSSKKLDRIARWKRTSTAVVAAKLGARIVSLREQRGWTQKRLAHECKIHRGFMGHQIERGENNLELRTLLTMAKNLNIAIHELFHVYCLSGEPLITNRYSASDRAAPVPFRFKVV